MLDYWAIGQLHVRTIGLSDYRVDTDPPTPSPITMLFFVVIMQCNIHIIASQIKSLLDDPKIRKAIYSNNSS